MIEIEVNEETWRQADAEVKDNGDDLTRNYAWLRLPEDVRCGLCILLGTMSMDELIGRGLSPDVAEKVLCIHVALL
jgi:hypothetical protein